MVDYGELAIVRGLHFLAESQAAIAHNLANVDSTGFKRRYSVAEPEPSSFESMLDQSLPVIQYREAQDWSPGSLLTTGDKTHVGLEGRGMLMVQDRGGNRYLTRNGRISIDAEGFLANDNGHRFVDATGQPIGLGSPDGVNVSRLGIGVDGSVTIGDTSRGRLGVFAMPGRQMQTIGDGLWVVDQGERLAAEPTTKVRQGSLERSNVDAMSELVQMITIQRGFQASTQLLGSIGRMKAAYVDSLNR